MTTIKWCTDPFGNSRKGVPKVSTGFCRYSDILSNYMSVYRCSNLTSWTSVTFLSHRFTPVPREVEALPEKSTEGV